MEISYEEQVIGCILLNNNLMKECYLQPHHFLNGNCKMIFCKMLELYKKNNSIDVVMLVDGFNGDEYLSTLIFNAMDNVVTTSSFAFYQEKQEELYKSTRIKEKIEDYDNKKLDYNELIDSIKNIDNECNIPTNNSRTMLSPNEILDLITTDKSQLQFEKFGYLQKVLGLMENTVNVIAARTSQGKSAFALNLMNDLSTKYKCLYFNMEMTEKEIYQRLVAINCGVPINDFYKIEEKDNGSRILRGIEEIQKRNIKIYQGAKNIKGLRTILTKESREEHCIAFIDYVGYVSSSKFNQNDRERIGEVVREIQLMSKELNVTIFLIAQINREGNEVPNLTNLKDSGELEQTAHCVMMIHNPEKDNIENQRPTVELLIPKNRSGQLSKLKLVFDKPTQRFLSYQRD